MPIAGALGPSCAAPASTRFQRRCGDHPIYALPSDKPEDVGALPLDSELLPGRAGCTRWPGGVAGQRDGPRPSSCSCAATAGRCCSCNLRADNAAAFGCPSTCSWAIWYGRAGRCSAPASRTRPGASTAAPFDQGAAAAAGKALQEGSKVTTRRRRYRTATRHVVHPKSPRCSAAGAHRRRDPQLFRPARLRRVDTRMLLQTNGGPPARPFRTHHNALDLDSPSRSLVVRACVYE